MQKLLKIIATSSLAIALVACDSVQDTDQPGNGSSVTVKCQKTSSGRECTRTSH